MQLTSPAFPDNGLIPGQFTCDGDNILPQLEISDVPMDTQSFVLIIDDPDVPQTIRPDGNWDHLLMWNIPGDIRIIFENKLPPGTVGRNSGGHTRYDGPCPPDKEHRYFFKLYALDTVLNVPAASDKTQLLENIQGHILTQCKLMGRYNRISKH